MADYKPYDVVRLKDGRQATIVESFENEYIVDVGDSPENWDSFDIKGEDIEEIIWEDKGNVGE